MSSSTSKHHHHHPLTNFFSFSASPVNDASSESSDGSASSDGSSSEGEDEHIEPPVESEEKAEPESNKTWNLSAFLPGGTQKSPNEPLSHEPPEAIKIEEHDEEEDGEIQRTPSDHYHNENSNSSVPDKSDVSQDMEEHQAMPPPAKVQSPMPDKTPDTDMNSVLSFIKNLVPNQPISSISDSDDNVDAVISGNERPKKKRPKKRPRPEIDGGNSSSDESSRFSESRRRSMDEKQPRGRQKNNSISLPPPVALPVPYEATNTSSDNSTKKAQKIKEPPSRKTTTNRRRQSEMLKKSRETIPSSDGSSDENEVRKPVVKSSPVKAKEQQPVAAKKPSKKKKSKVVEKIESPIASSSDSKHSPAYHHHSVPHHSSSSSHSDSDASSRSSAGVKSKKIQKIVSDKNKQATLHKLFNSTKVSEGGKGGKGGAKGKGQVVVITPEDAQNQSKSNESTASSNGAVSVQNPKYLSPSSAFITAVPSVLVQISLARIDLTRLNLPAEKLKHAAIPTKSPAVPAQVEPPRKSKKRRRSSNHDEQDRWRHHASSNKNYDQLSVSSSSSASSSSANSEQHQIDNPATRVTSYTTNYTNDRLNNNHIDHKTKDLNNFYHSPSSVDTKLPKIKRETIAYGGYSASPIKDGKSSSNDFKNKIKQEVKEEFDGTQDMRKRATSMTNNSHTYKDKKRKRPDGASDNSLPMPPTNHERLPMSGLVNGDMMTSKPEVKRVYFSYFERMSDEVEQAEAM